MDIPQIIATTVACTAAACYIGALLCPPIGRLISPKWPRLGEGLIQFGSDLKGVSQTLELPPGTPSISAVHPIEKAAVAAEVSAKAASVRPPPDAPSNG